MKTNKIWMLAAAMTMTMAAVAQESDWDRQYEIWLEGSSYFANEVEVVTKIFDDKLATGGGSYANSPEYYAVSDVDGDGKGDLWVRTADKKRGVVFSRRGGKIEVLGVESPGHRLSFPQVEPDSMMWSSFDEITYCIDAKKDVTLCHRPLPVFHTKQACNTYVTQLENNEIKKGFNPKKYDRMIFKPHVGDVVFVKQEKEPNYEITRFTYKLKTAARSKTMFRGYNDDEFASWLVPAAYLNDHDLLQFSRWKAGEAKQSLTPDGKAIVSRYYGGRGIVASQWLASAPESERSFYAVQFANEGTDALAALVCIAEGEVISTLNYHGTVQSGEIQSIWFVDDEGDFMEHVPEIQCMVSAPEGLELYIRQFGGESVSYIIVREVGRSWMSISRDYEIYAW